MNNEDEIGSPAKIQILLHCHCNPTVYPELNKSNIPYSAARETMDKYVDMGVLVRESADRYETTELGRHWVAALCQVRLPRVMYVDMGGNEIVIKP